MLLEEFGISEALKEIVQHSYYSKISLSPDIEV